MRFVGFAGEADCCYSSCSAGFAALLSVLSPDSAVPVFELAALFPFLAISGCSADGFAFAIASVASSAACALLAFHLLRGFAFRRALGYSCGRGRPVSTSCSRTRPQLSRTL